VLKSPQETAALIQNIAQSAEAQAQSFDQVNEGFTSISDVIAETTATAEESAAQSEEAVCPVSGAQGYGGEVQAEGEVSEFRSGKRYKRRRKQFPASFFATSRRSVKFCLHFC
jgi:hypothetical protein